MVQVWGCTYITSSAEGVGEPFCQNITIDVAPLLDGKLSLDEILSFYIHKSLKDVQMTNAHVKHFVSELYSSFGALNQV